MQKQENVATPLARELARELAQAEIDEVSGAGQTAKGTIAEDQQFDPSGDHWLPK